MTGHGKIQGGEATSRLQHPGHLGDRGCHALHIAKKIGEDHGIKVAVRIIKLLRSALDQRDLVLYALPLHVPLAPLEHTLAQVDAYHMGAVVLRDLNGHSRCACAHVQHPLPGRDLEAGDQEPPPAPVLPEAQHLGKKVVTTSDPVEQGTSLTITLVLHVYNR